MTVKRYMCLNLFFFSLNVWIFYNAAVRYKYFISLSIILRYHATVHINVPMYAISTWDVDLNSTCYFD